MPSILRVRDDTGKVIEIPAIKGDPFRYEDFTEEQLDALAHATAQVVMDTANICYVSTAILSTDAGKDGDICIVTG